MKSLSTRGRVAVLVVLSALPALGLMIHGALEQRGIAEALARDNLQRYARLAAAQHEQTVESVRQLLSAISGVMPSLMRDRQACHEYFRGLMVASHGLYHSMGVHLASGDLYCNAATWDDGINVADRYYFRAALDSGRFSIGEHQVGRAPGTQGMDFGHPVLDADKKVVGVVFARLDLKRLNELSAATPQLPGTVLALFDRGGAVLALHPVPAARGGDKGSAPRLSGAVRAARRGVYEAADVNGVPQLYAFESVGENPDGSVPLRVIAGIHKQVAYAEAHKSFFKAVGGLVVVTTLLLLAGWYGAEILVLRNLRKLLDVARRVHAGDLTARTGLQGGREEISRIGSAFDQMAQSLQDRDSELQRALRESRELAITDPLTGLHNRRYLWELLGRELVKARRKRTPVAAILADVDHFKRFNDTWGHQAGDLVLKRVADVIREHVRGSDIACRYGGEEMAVIVPEAAMDVAVERAERIRRGIAALRLDYDGRPLDAVTASFGVAIYPQHAGDAETLLRAADDALYQAKKAGRNQVVVSRAVPAVP